MSKFSIVFFLLFLVQKVPFAQSMLPEITVTQLGKRVLVSWDNPYSNVSSISVQRSNDSLKNYTSIGSVLNVGPGINGYTDPKEFIPSEQYYRLFISFEGGSYIFTHSHRPGADTLNEIPVIDNQPATVGPHYDRNLFVPSNHVYTGRDNNVIISLPDAARKKYSIKFYQENGNFLFEIKKVTENYLTLDKVNFIHSGLFIFELYDNHIIIERHKFFIPKDGQPMPPLDPEGHEIRFN